MKSAPREILKEYVRSQQFTSTSEIMQAIKEMFRDVIQQAMEVEMDEELGRERCQRSQAPEGKPRNYRNGYSKKTVKTQLGEVEIQVPRDRMGAYEPKIIGKYDRNAEGMEEKILALYACGMSQRDIAEQIILPLPSPQAYTGSCTTSSKPCIYSSDLRSKGLSSLHRAVVVLRWFGLRETLLGGVCRREGKRTPAHL